jgi:hypothetical protein
MSLITEANPVRFTTSAVTVANRWDHILARVGVRRSDHRVEPGLYAIGRPSTDSPVFVTANYTLSFDALRSALAGIDSYILVIDTRGINVWCAAGKGSFGTEELVNRIEAVALGQIVGHRVVILPQLAAPGIAAHEVRRRSGFKVEYGPVRAADLPEYLKAGSATPEMRTVRFDLVDRVTLIPVELTNVLLPSLAVAVLLYFFIGLLASAGFVAAIVAGVVLFPILLPWIPTTDFSAKGYLLGVAVALPFAVTAALGHPGAQSWMRLGEALVYLLALPPATSFVALNFTGSTTFTSWTQVRREMFAYIPRMALSFAAGILLLAVLILASRLGGS